MASAVLQFRSMHSLLPNERDEVVSARWDEIGRKLWRRMELGEVSFVEQRRIRLRDAFLLELSDDEADSLFAEYLSFYEENWALLPGAVEFLAATLHLPRAIVTNGNKPQVQRKISKLGLASHFQAVVTPEDCGARKPNPKIFLHALELLGVKPSEALMVGDNHDADIAPALALGMRMFRVNPSEPGQSIRYAASAA